MPRGRGLETGPRAWYKRLLVTIPPTVSGAGGTFPKGRASMKVHEYQAKELLKSAGVAVPEGVVISKPEEAAGAYDKLGGGLMVVKAQVHAGGRGKGVAVGPEVDRGLALEIASGLKPRPDGMAKGVQLVRS